MRVDVYKAGVLYNHYKHQNLMRELLSPVLQKDFSQNEAPNSSAVLNNNFLNSFIIQNNINFGASRISGRGFPLIRYHNYISCPCCGEKMVNSNKDKQQELAYEFAGKKGKELSLFIRENINEIQTSKRGLAEKIASYALKHQEEDISQILDSISSEYIDSLRKKQIAILNDMTNELRKRSGGKTGIIKNWHYNQMDRITHAKEKDDFRNKYLVRSFTSLAKRIGVSIEDAKIQEYFDKLPNSRSDIDAFVVKYRKRPPEETALRMLKTTTASVEHIIPFSKSENNGFENLLIMCSDCNFARDNMDYKTFLKIHPYMKQNIKKYFNDIETILNSESTNHKIKTAYKNYIKNVKKTLEIYTKGQLGSKKKKAHKN